ncbi:MAG: NAD-dependent epimerase [Synechococcales bacterium]|nr:NAD-dependent epimerase [Synechococcales bacterium]
MKILITGVAGFIGYHLAIRYLNEGHEVYGIDNLNDYYDINLKYGRLFQIQSYDRFTFQCLDLSDRTATLELFQSHSFDRVIHLAAQAGVRYSLKNPHAYLDSNLAGFLNILEGCRQAETKHLVYASSSSVYGANQKVPFSISDRVDHPVSLYAATKKANELMAHTYSDLYQIPTTGLRFFTVYGPWGRPDMAYFKFVQAIDRGQPIDVYNFGKMQRDFTYIDDIIEGVVRVAEKIPAGNCDQTENLVPYRLYNIGNHSPVSLMTFIETIEQIMGKTAVKNFLPMQPGDVPTTYADVDDLMQAVDFKPATPLALGLQRFISWYQDFYQISLAA